MKDEMKMTEPMEPEKLFLNSTLKFTADSKILAKHIQAFSVALRRTKA